MMSLPQVLARQHSVNDIVTEFKSIALACTGGTSSVFIPSGPISAASRDGEDDASQVVGASPLYATRSVAGSSATPSNHASIARESVSDVLHTDLPWSLVRYAVGCMETVVVGDVAQSNFAGDEYFQESSVKVRHTQSCTPLYHLCLMLIPERDGVSAVQHDKLFGVVYVEHKQSLNAFTKSMVPVMTAIGTQFAISYESIEKTEQLDASLRTLQELASVGTRVAYAI